MVDCHNSIRNICHHFLIKPINPSTPGHHHPIETLWAERRKAPRPFFPRYWRSMGRPAQHLPTCAIPRAPRGQMRHLHILTLGDQLKLLELVDGATKCFKPCPRYMSKSLGLGIIILNTLEQCWTERVCSKPTAKPLRRAGSPKCRVGFIFRHPCDAFKLGMLCQRWCLRFCACSHQRKQTKNDLRKVGRCDVRCF